MEVYFLQSSTNCVRYSPRDKILLMDGKINSAVNGPAPNSPIVILSDDVVEQDRKRFDAILDNLKQRVGEKKWERESVRARCMAIASLQIDLERDIEGQLNGATGKLMSRSPNATGGTNLLFRQGDAERTIHITGQMSALLKALGLRDDD